MAKAPDKETQGDKRPEPAQPVASSRAPAIAVSLAALAVIGAATANSLPSFGRFSLPDFDQFSLPKVSLPKVDRFSLPDFSRFSLPNFNRVAAQPPPKTAPAPIPDPVVRAALKDIQLSQQENAAALVSLTQSAGTQQVDLKRISRQLALLTAQVDTLQIPATPLTTSSIPPSNPRARLAARAPLQTAQADTLQDPMTPLTTSSIPHSNPRARIVRASRKVLPYFLLCPSLSAPFRSEAPR